MGRYRAPGGQRRASLVPPQRPGSDGPALRRAAGPRSDGGRGGVLEVPFRPGLQGRLRRDARQLPHPTASRTGEGSPAFGELDGDRGVHAGGFLEPGLVQHALLRARWHVPQCVSAGVGRSWRTTADPRLFSYGLEPSLGRFRATRKRAIREKPEAGGPPYPDGDRRPPQGTKGISS